MGPETAALLIAGAGTAASVAGQREQAKEHESLKPQGKIGVIDDMAVLDAMPLKTKSLSLGGRSSIVK